MGVGGRGAAWPLGAGKGLWPHPAPAAQDSDYVVAVRNFLPEDPALLAFHKGDIIHLQPPKPPRPGRCLGWGGHAGGLGQGSLAVADTYAGCRLQCRLCRPQEGGVPGGAAAERPRLRWVWGPLPSFSAPNRSAPTASGFAVPWPGQASQGPAATRPALRLLVWWKGFRERRSLCATHAAPLPEGMPSLPKPRPSTREQRAGWVLRALSPREPSARLRLLSHP